MTGKQKCKILKQIRKQIADANDIRYVIEECSHKGKCKGTCPRCEWEVRMLERELEKRRLSGKKVALAGISAGVIVSSATACTPVEIMERAFNKLIGNEIEGNMALEGDVPYTPDTLQPLEGETEIVEPLMGDPVPESDISYPGEIVEETAVGEVVADVDGLIALPETDYDPDDEPEFAGVPPFECETETDPEWEGEAEIPVLEGDIAYPADEDEWDETEELMIQGILIPPEEETP